MYPGAGKVFFTFRLKRDSQDVLCSCSVDAILSYLRFRLRDPVPDYVDEMRHYILSAQDFPYEFIKTLIQKGIPNDAKAFNYLHFEEGLCHECNIETPSSRFCVPMYGTIFRQKYGWYINKQAYEWGVHPGTYRMLSDRVPESILPPPLPIQTAQPVSISSYAG